MSGSYPDIAADWTQLLPNHDDIDGYHVTSGTSFATPGPRGSSARSSRICGQVRRHGLGASEERSGLLVVPGLEIGAITNSDLRDALNLSAWYPSFSSWNPTAGTLPISPVAPCTQSGGAWSTCPTSNPSSLTWTEPQRCRQGQRTSSPAWMPTKTFARPIGPSSVRQPG